MRSRLYRRLAAGLLLSFAAHFLIGAFFPPAHREMQPAEFRVTSSALKIEHRPKPRPRVQTKVVPRASTLQTALVPQPPRPQRALPKELARITPRAPEYQPHRSQPSPQALLPQPDFQKTIAKLRRQNDPLLAAAAPVQTPAAAKRYATDFSGSIGSAPSAEGVLTPTVGPWHNGDGYNYYYVEYWVRYADGTSETGNVPWPLRYRPETDPFRLHYEHFPLPLPLADFALPAGTNLHPLLAYCLKHRAEITSCPIEHD